MRISNLAQCFSCLEWDIQTFVSSSATPQQINTSASEGKNASEGKMLLISLMMCEPVPDVKEPKKNLISRVQKVVEADKICAAWLSIK